METLYNGRTRTCFCVAGYFFSTEIAVAKNLSKINDNKVEELSRCRSVDNSLRRLVCGAMPNHIKWLVITLITFHAISNKKQLLDEAKYDRKNYTWVSWKEQAHVMKTVTLFFISYLRPLHYYIYIYFFFFFCFLFFVFNATLLLLVSPFLISPFD